MIDAHCHVSAGEAGLREILIGRDAMGVHPWDAETCESVEFLREALQKNPQLLVGEIGLDRLRSRDISEKMREVFLSQLELAAEFGRPVILHGAKCWGEVVRAVRPYAKKIPAMLFHGFSRSDGLIPEIAKLNGFISVGPAILNDHAVNYRELAKKIPSDMLLVETDRTATSPSIHEVAEFLAAVRGISLAELDKIVTANIDRFGMKSSLGDCPR